jgi:hypothetical protein
MKSEEQKKGGKGSHQKFCALRLPAIHFVALRCLTSKNSPKFIRLRGDNTVHHHPKFDSRMKHESNEYLLL